MVLAGTTRYDMPPVGLWWDVYGKQREAELWGRNASPPCTLSAGELRRAEPSDETVRRFHARMASMEEPLPPGVTGPSGIAPRPVDLIQRRLSSI